MAVMKYWYYRAREMTDARFIHYRADGELGEAAGANLI